MSHKNTAAETELLRLKAEFMEKKAPFYYQSISVQQAKGAADFPARGRV